MQFTLIRHRLPSDSPPLFAALARPGSADRGKAASCGVTMGQWLAWGLTLVALALVAAEAAEAAELEGPELDVMYLRYKQSLRLVGVIN